MDHKNHEIWPGWETVRFVRTEGHALVYEIRRDSTHAMVTVRSIPDDPGMIQTLEHQGCDRKAISQMFQEQMQQIVSDHRRMQRSMEDIRCIPKEDGLGWTVYIRTNAAFAVDAACTDSAPLHTAFSSDGDTAASKNKGSSVSVVIAAGIALTVLALLALLVWRLIPKLSPDHQNLDYVSGPQQDIPTASEPSTYPPTTVPAPTSSGPTAPPTSETLPMATVAPTEPATAPRQLRSDPHVTDEDYDQIIKNVILSIDTSDATVFGSHYTRDQISSITFLDTTAGAPLSGHWDVSEDLDGSVIAWVTPQGSLYDLYIASDGGVVAPENCDSLFAEYINVTCIDFGGCFDTSRVTNMQNMFHFCMSLTELDVTGFDTSNVTDMRNMFFACRSLPELDVSGFDTSHVTDMRFMFTRCSSLTVLDVSGFDTSNVVYMDSMFNRCRKVKTLDVSGFDTGNVKQMCFLFAFCDSLTELDVTGFDTSKTENMEGMFNHCIALETLNVKNFDTSRVNNMRQMFRDCTSLKVLDVTGFDLSGLNETADLDDFMAGTDLYDPFAGWEYTG